MHFFVNDIGQKGLGIYDDLFSKDDLINIHKEILKRRPHFKKSGIGKGASVHNNIRGDYIQWIEKDDPLESIQKIISFLDDLKDSLNQKLFLGIQDHEEHMAYYPANTFYRKHLDQVFKSEKKRILTFIIYLNFEWEKDHGGELKVYLKNNESLTIEPQAGRLVLFLSDQFPHEVLMSHRERFSLTGWFFRH